MPRIPHSDICYGGTPISPMGHARHPLGGKGDIPKALGDNPYAPWNRHLRPLEPAPSPLEARTFDLRNLRLRKEKRFFTHFKGKTLFVVTLVTSLLPQVPVFQIVLQGGNGCKGKKLYVVYARGILKLLLSNDMVAFDQKKKWIMQDRPRVSF